MTGSRGYVCSDGPLAGTVLMLGETAEPGSLWSAPDASGTNLVYRFVSNHFEHVPIDINRDASSPES